MTTKLDALRDEIMSLLHYQGIEQRLPHTQFMMLVDDLCDRILEDVPELEKQKA